MSAAPQRQIDYDPELTLKQNIKRARKILRIDTTTIVKATGLSRPSVNAYIGYNLRSANGNQTPTSRILRDYISGLFAGGIPDDIITEDTQTHDLYELYGCAKCRYRMRSQPGCYKFSITRTEINRGYTIITQRGGAIRLSAKSRCPYACTTSR
jgi:hypothetical protein